MDVWNLGGHTVVSRILVTFPGRFGDLLHAMPTCRALAHAADWPVDVAVAHKYRAITPLLMQQPYIGLARGDEMWQVEETAPMTPRCPPWPTAGMGPYDEVYHLGYADWPTPTLAEDIYARASAGFHTLPPLDLDRPWIALPPGDTALIAPHARPRVWLAWSEEWFELKVGLTQILAQRFPQVDFWWVRPWGGRYDEVAVGQAATTKPDLQLARNVSSIRTNWLGAALAGASCDVYLGCLSSQWVLADGMGKPCIVVEPNPQRHHPVFWREAEKNHLVLGNDGKPTFDARAAGDALAGWLEEFTR